MLGPKALLIATSAASRPRAMSTRPTRGVLLRAEQGYEITVRFRGGKTAVFNDTYPTNWRVGSRLILIGGVDASPD